MRVPGLAVGLALLAAAPAGCGIESSELAGEDVADVNQAEAASATWGNPIVVEGSYAADCRPTGVVDRGILAGEHYFEFYGDFRCGHSFSFPTPIYGWQCSLGASASARTTFSGTSQVNAAFTVPFEPYARCFVTISSWNQGAAIYELIL